MIDITADNIAETLHRYPGPVLLNFHAPWCAPCKALEPWLVQLESRYQGQLTVLSCDVQQHETAIDIFALRGVPVLIGFIAGEEVARCTGGNVAQLHAIVNRLLQAPAPQSTGTAFNSDVVTFERIAAQVAALPEAGLAGQVAQWIQHPGAAPGIPPLVWQLMLFLAQQFPEGASKPAFITLLQAIPCGSDLSAVGLRLARQLLSSTTSGLDELFAGAPESAACWQALQGLQLAWLRGERPSLARWQAADARRQQLTQNTDPALAARAQDLALLATPVDSSDLSLFLELYRLASDELADRLYERWPDENHQACQAAIDRHLRRVAEDHARLVAQIFATSPRPGD